MARWTRLIPAVLALVGAAGLRTGWSGPLGAGAAVDRAVGFHATVDGWTSWYGAYGMGPLGPAWCIDHGIAAPDPDLAYVPTPVDDHAPDTRRAMAWALFRAGRDPDAVGAAALMLVLHDLMGATYPAGPLDVDSLTLDRLAGFDGHEAEVIDRARSIKADAVAHAGLVVPFVMAATARDGALAVTLADAEGRPVDGLLVHVAASGSRLAGPVEAVTGADGHLVFPFEAVDPESTFDLTAEGPGPLDAYAPTLAPAQRVARPSAALVEAHASFAPPPPETTTSTSTSTTSTTEAPTTTTTTAAPTTTTTEIPTTTTEIPTTTSPSTTATTSTTEAPTTTSTTEAPVVVEQEDLVPPPVDEASPPEELPRTGAPVRRLTGVACELLAVGLLLSRAASSADRRGRRRLRPMPPW